MSEVRLNSNEQNYNCEINKTEKRDTTTNSISDNNTNIEKKRIQNNRLCVN
mgnify:CR=1 FL=1